MSQGTLFGDDRPLRDPRDVRPAPHHRDGRDTEVEAAALVTPRAGTIRAEVVSLLARVYPGGLPGITVADTLGRNLYSVLPRITELAGDGWVEDTGQREPTGKGGNGIVWSLTADGYRRWQGDL